MGRKFERALARYLNNEMDARERAEFEQWLDSLASEEDEERLQLTDARQAALLQKIKGKMHEPKPDKTPRFNPASLWLKAAAAIALVAVASWLIIPRLVNPVESITALSPDEVRKSILADGTIVWLRADSKLAYNLSADGQRREATLMGDALFEVAKDPSRPFVIDCGNISVRVTGTSFSLHATPDTLMLTVLTGTVNVFTATDTLGVTVKAHEKLLQVGAGEAEKQAASRDDLPVYLPATQYDMAFSHATLDEVFTRLEKKFDVTLKHDEAIDSCTITADFTDMSLPATLSMLAQVHGITYTQQGTVITIAGEGCTR